MLPEIEIEENHHIDWENLYEYCIADMLADPNLTDEEKQKLLRELELPDEVWAPIELPEGAEPFSVTLIKMRRGELNDLVL